MKLMNVKGTSDSLPKEELIKRRVVNTLTSTFEKFGYMPLDTTILCYYDLLASKYAGGSEILKEVYTLNDQGDRKLGLRYDLTVPFSKVISMNVNKNITLPLKRYEVGKVFRDGPVKTGRAREFYQCDVDVCGIEGTFIEGLFPLSKLGGIATKGTTGQPRPGNPAPRIAETPSGMINSVGLQNPGIDAFLKRELPNLLTKDTVILANIAGSTIEECVSIAEKLDATDVHMIELNISCPNVKKGGAAFGVHCDSAETITAAVRKATSKPLIVKLSPNVTSITDIAKAVESAGADAVSLINTLLGMRIQIETRRPILRNNVGGMSGPAVFPLAVRMVWQTANAVSIPVIGMGGVSSGADAIEMMMAGASAVQVGAAIFTDPYAPIRIIDEMNAWLDAHHIASVQEIIGTVQPW